MLDHDEYFLKDLTISFPTTTYTIYLQLFVMHIQPLQSKWSNNWKLPVENILCNVHARCASVLPLTTSHLSQPKIACKPFPLMWWIAWWGSETLMIKIQHIYLQPRSPMLIFELVQTLTSCLSYSNGALEENDDFRQGYCWHD